MQYLIYTSGEVLNRYDKAYIIKAPSKEKAQEIARKSFTEEFNVTDENIYVKPYKRTYRAIVAYAFMLIPILLSFINWKVGHDTVSIRPDYISCLYAVLFYGAFIVRFKGVQRTIGSWIDIVFCFVIVILLSSFIQTILVTKTFNILLIKEVSINTKMVLPIAIILSWLGLKQVSAACIVGIGVLSFFNITALSNAMGCIYGPAYIIGAFMGILFYLSIEPALIEALPHFKKSVRSGLNCMRNDFVEAGNSAKKLGNAAVNHKVKKELNFDDTSVKDLKE